jgi:MSHA biogenesis protein MshG
MARYHYRGRDASGASVEGTVDAVGVDAVVTQLQRQRITPVSVTEQKATSEQARKSVFDAYRARVTLDDMSMFCRQMHALTKSGMPVMQSIAGLAELSRSPRMREALDRIGVRLRAGVGLAAAMREHPDVFTDIFVAMVSVGENTGRMDDAFRKLIDHVEMERLTRSQLSQALRYPLLVMGAMLAAMLFVNVFVIPNFSRVFARLGKDLPLPTQVLMISSEFIVQWWWVLAVFAAGGAVMFLQWVATDKGRLRWDGMKLNFPIIGPITQRIVLARFARTFAMMSQSGVPVVQALAAVGTTVGNARVKDAVMGIRRGVERGDSVTRSAAGTGLFTPLILQMMAVGEETGTLDTLLHDVADFYEQEVTFSLRRLSEAIEPLVLVVLGVMVLVLALGVFLPMWDISSGSYG